MKIAYYISDYGFGHATRSTSIIRNLLKLREDLSVVVCHSYAIDFMKKSLPNDRVEFRNITTDFGYILQEGATEVAPLLLRKEYQSWTNNRDYWLEKEKGFLLIENIGAVISDISPFGIAAACEMNIPSIAVSNFTWYTAYQELLTQQELLPLKRDYEKVDYFIHLAGSYESAWGRIDNLKCNFYCREADWDEVKEIKKTINPYGDKNLVFFGLGMKVNNLQVNNLPLWDSENCIFVVSSNVKIDHANVIKIPYDYLESQNYVAAADLVISKAGWGTISEAVCYNTSLLLLNRPKMKEDKNTIKFVEDHQLGFALDIEELSTLIINEDIIKKVNEQCHNDYINESHYVANKIIKILFKSKTIEEN